VIRSNGYYGGSYDGYSYNADDAHDSSDKVSGL
jgi:hypothetical protein